MTKQDVHKLFDLLEHLYQGKKQIRDDVTVAIWAKVFEPWSYPQVRQAVIERARINRYYPDPSEIAEFLPPAPVTTATHSTPTSLSERVNDTYRNARNAVALCLGDLEQALRFMNHEAKQVIAEMGGIEKFAPPDEPFYDYYLFEQTYHRLVDSGVI